MNKLLNIVLYYIKNNADGVIIDSHNNIVGHKDFGKLSFTFFKNIS